MARRHDEYEHRSGDSGRNVLGVLIVALLAVGLVFLGYLAFYDRPQGVERLEVNSFEMTPGESPVGESAVQEAPALDAESIRLPEPEFESIDLPGAPAERTGADETRIETGMDAPETNESRQ